jgi:hypothetical protein
VPARDGTRAGRPSCPSGVGVETVAPTPNRAFRSLYRHPEIERRPHAEVDRVLGGRAATRTDPPSLELTGRVVHDALRLFPGRAAHRVVTEDTELAGRAPPAGGIVAWADQQAPAAGCSRSAAGAGARRHPRPASDRSGTLPVAGRW